METQTKRCYSCEQVKPLDGFPVNQGRPDGRNSMCKACKKIYNAAHYVETKDRFNAGRAEARTQRRDDSRERVYAYLREHPCVDCGETDIVVLDFDHQRVKIDNVSSLVAAGYGWDAVLREIEKCEVVCANDHRRRTARTFGWRRAIPV
jgi:ferredoxin